MSTQVDTDTRTVEMRVMQGAHHQSIRDMLDEHLTGDMKVEGGRGDLRVTWNARDTDEVEAARKQFDDLRAKSFLAFAVGDDGEKGNQITEFDPQAQKIILAPPMAGGA